MTVRVHQGAHTAQGRREDNEDATISRPNEGIYVVADGTGGRASGQVAARMACESVAAELAAARGGEFEVSAQDRNRIDQAVRNAHQKIRAAQSDAQHHGMATTLVIAIIGETRAHLAHVGDSRAYLLRDGRLQCLTRDHNLANYLADHPEVSPKVQRPGTTLMRALGMEAEAPQAEHRTIDLLADDVILLCSDGISGALPEWVLGELLGAVGPLSEQEAAKSLAQAAMAHGSMDNLTAQVLRIESETTQNLLRAPVPFGWLTFLEGPRRGEVITLGATNLVGSSAECQVRVEDSYAGRKHLQIHATEDGFALRDLGSTNGTFLNEVRVKEQALADADVIRIGGTKMVFKTFRAV